MTRAFAAARGSDPNPGPDTRPRSALERGLERRLVLLMGARLGLSLVSLVVALAIEAAGGDFTTAEWKGFYSTIALSFTATVAYGLALNRVIRPLRFAALNVVTDIAIVTALVHFSGGHDSAFQFLYLLVAASAAMLFDVRGALAAAGLAIAAYGTILFAGHLHWIPSLAIAPAEAVSTLVTTWIVTAGAVLIVAILASLLTAELRKTGAVLDQRTLDLKRLQNLHQRTVESLMSGLLTTDEALRITSFNPEAVRITGVPMQAAIGRSVESILPGIRGLTVAASSEIDASHRRTRMRYRNRRGDDVHLGLAVYVLLDAARAPGGFVVIFQDVTSVVAMENDLRRSERLAAIGALSASIAHEVRNPLAAISGSIQVLQDQIGLEVRGGEPRQLMEIVLRETDRLNRLITDFLLYARPGPAVVQSVDIAASVEDVIKMFEATRPDGIHVDVDIPTGLRVEADASKLHQVLWNLVLNGSEAMPDGGVLQVTAKVVSEETPQESVNFGRNVAREQHKTNSVEIAVSDSGVGVPLEALERVFDPFFTTKANGSGLGLAAVHQIVEEHGGIVRFESGQGRGTTVRVRFPRAEVGK